MSKSHIEPERVYRDIDNDSNEIIRKRAIRFREEWENFERRFNVSLADEVEGAASQEYLGKITSGEIDVIPALSKNDLWSLLISLHFDLPYILWNKRSVDGI